jgi:menaquinone-specific isochorismate synthase
MVLPRFELNRENDRHVLACNLLPGDLTTNHLRKIAAEAERLAEAPQRSDPEQVKLVSRRDNPDHERWFEEVTAAIDRFRKGSLEKQVLARRTELEFDGNLDPWFLLEQLRGSASNCFLFGFQPAGGPAFIGATPERLYQRAQDRIETEAVAGTRPRGVDTASDSALELELSLSEKERVEHRLVVTGLREGLERIGTDCRVEDVTGSLKLARLQHLVTRLSGRLKAGTPEHRIISALHPSPAVGGYPTELAPNIIREAEPFDRGWYAGPIGWIQDDRAEFAVAIRSALVDGARLTLYAGAGLVSDSDPEAEWLEVESKIDPFLRLFDEKDA